jgi:phosphatidylinositol alpha-1,6-mannosyltransferase
MKILFLTPDLFGSHGGIARHCRLAVKAMTESPRVEAVDVISLLDRRASVPDARYFGPRGRAYLACGGNRRDFVARVVSTLRSRYDLVIAGHVNFAPLVAHRSGARVTLIYGIDAWARLPWLRRVSLQRSHRVLSISRFTADAAIRANDLDQRKVDIVACCLDPFLSEASPPATGDFRGLGQNSLLTVSRLSLVESSKGHDVILRSLPRVLASVPEATYAVVGDGDLKPALERLSAELGLRDHVRFLGALPDSEVQRCYRTCTAYVMPSKWEGFGLVFLEAMEHARPVIASQRDAATEVMGDSALLVDPDDPEALAHTIVNLLGSPALQARLGQAGRARLDERFRYEHFRASLLGRLEQCAA